MSKIKIGGIMQTTGLAKVGVMSIPDQPGIAGKVMSAMGERSINVQFIVQLIDIHDYGHVVFCIAEDELSGAQDILESVRQEVGAHGLRQRGIAE